jgi:3-oxoisoapionate kinase
MAANPILSFYGDDFTGSTDAMEVLASNNMDTMLFLRIPTKADIEATRGAFAAIGIAGMSRSKDVEWMDGHLPEVFDSLAQVAAPICHYKVCSTFDSSPRIGNIGRAIQIGRERLHSSGATPLVVGAPALKRYTVFGQLFASVGTEHYRIDRHPTMSVHPVTPMDEADLRLHLQRQAPLRVGLFDVVSQRADNANELYAERTMQNDVVLIDVFDAASQECAGRLLWQQACARPLFCVGSSGVEYALASHWRATGQHRVGPRSWTTDPVKQIIAVSGSCSPVTAAQIDAAEADGFLCLRADVCSLLDDGSREVELGRMESASLQALAEGRSVLIYTARGPKDPALNAVSTFIAENRLDSAVALSDKGRELGRLLRRLADASGVSRLAVAGGDTSGHVVDAFGLSALTMRATLAPGGPLCSGYVEAGKPPTIEIALKGGQIGGPRYFSSVREGRNLD